jgi:hypothetical protein
MCACASRQGHSVEQEFRFEHLDRISVSYLFPQLILYVNDRVALKSMTPTDNGLVSSKVRIHYSSNKASGVLLSINAPICPLVNDEVHQLEGAVHSDQEEVHMKIGDVPVLQGNA